MEVFSTQLRDVVLDFGFGGLVIARALAPQLEILQLTVHNDLGRLRTDDITRRSSAIKV